MSSKPASAQVASSQPADAQPESQVPAARPKPARKVYLDLINVLAIIFVVALHVRFNYRVDYDSPGWVSRTFFRVPRLRLCRFSSWPRVLPC